MIDEKEKQRYIEASKCDNCLQWHKHCNAECCKIVRINVNPKELDKCFNYLSVKPGSKLGLSDIKYYKNRDVGYLRGNLRFKKERCEVIGGMVYYFHPCSRLKGNLCMDHKDGKKPELCKALTLETAKLPGQPFYITPNCLFKYKSKEVNKND